MKKLVSLLLAMMVACMMVPAMAEVTAETVTGEWFVTEMLAGEMSINPADMGMEISLVLNEDGTMVMTMAGESQNGTWALADGKVQLTAGEGDEASTVEMTVEEDGTLKGGDEGQVLVFSREKPEGLVIPTPVDAESEDAFLGTWNVYMIGMDGQVMPLSMMTAAGFEIGGTMTIEAGKATMSLNLIVEIPEITGTTAFADGKLSLTVEGVETPFVIQATDTGALYTEFVSPDAENPTVMPLYFEKAE